MAEYQQAGPPPDDEPPVEDQDGPKRKRNDNQGQPRTKRNRYISIACNECKRRKIKCNGENPCQRCGNLDLECLYAPNCCNNNFKDTQEFKNISAHIMSLQEQVDALYQNLMSLRGNLGQELPQQIALPYNVDGSRSMPAPQASMIDPALSRNKQGTVYQLATQVPQNSTYSFDIARSSLQSMGDADGIDGSAPQENLGSGQEHLRLQPSAQVLADMTKDDATRLCKAFEAEVGIVYPFLDTQYVSRFAAFIIGIGQASRQANRTVQSAQGEDFSAAEDMDILRLTLAVAIVAEGDTISERGRTLFETSFSGKEFQSQASLTSIQILTLSALYRFYTDDEGLSWRLIGIAARLCVELGLNRGETYGNLPSNEERNKAINVFWTVYVLDRCYSFETGMSFALQDAVLDPALPQPGESCPMLTAAISYIQIQAEALQLARAARSATQFNETDSTHIDYEADRWYKSLPDQYNYTHPSTDEHAQYGSEVNSRDGIAMYRHRVILYLRRNHLRIQAYRPVLQSASLMLSESTSDYTRIVVDVAKDTIKIITHIHATSDVYRTQPVSFSAFLTSALAVLLLAVSNAPQQLSEQCRDEFGMALDLVRGLSARSPAGKRLVRTMRSLKELGPELLRLHAKTSSTSMATKPSEVQRGDGVASSRTQRDAHSSAAMAMTTLAGHPVDEHALLETHEKSSGGTDSANDGVVTGVDGASLADVANDLSSFFQVAETYGKANSSAKPTSGRGKGGKSTRAGSGGVLSSGGASASMAAGSEEEFGRIVRDLF